MSAASVLLVCENYTRDYASLAFTSKKLLELYPNLRICICSNKTITYQFLRLHRFKVIIWPHPRSPFIFWSWLLGSHNIVHETEGIPYYDSFLFHSPGFLSSFTVSQVWCWGEYQYQLLKKRFSASNFKPHVLNTGSLRYFYQLSISPQVVQKYDESLRILFPTNFNILSPRYQSVYKEMLDHSRNYILPTSSPNVFLTWMISESERRTRLMLLVSSISKFLNLHRLIIRPHPYESPDFYQDSDILKDTEFSLDDPSVNISESLLKCDLVIASGCQTVLDALIMGKPCFGDPSSNYNIWDKFTLDIADIPSVDVQSLPELASKQLRSAMSNGLSHYLSNLLHPDGSFEFGYFEALISKPRFFLLKISWLTRYFSDLLFFLAFFRRAFLFSIRLIKSFFTPSPTKSSSTPISAELALSHFNDQPHIRAKFISNSVFLSKL